MENEREKLIERLKAIKNEYSVIHDELKAIETSARQLESDRSVVSAKLTSARDEEKELINKLEENLGTKLTYDTLVSLINK